MKWNKGETYHYVSFRIYQLWFLHAAQERANGDDRSIDHLAELHIVRAAAVNSAVQTEIHCFNLHKVT